MGQSVKPPLTFLREAGSLMLSRLTQPLKSPMAVTPAGISRALRPVHPRKPSTLRTPPGISILRRAVQFWNDDAPRDFMVLGRPTAARAEQFAKVHSSISDTPSGTITRSICSQPEKAYLPICVTYLGISIAFRLLQPEKANAPISVRRSGSSMEMSAEQSAKRQSVICLS